MRRSERKRGLISTSRLIATSLRPVQRSRAAAIVSAYVVGNRLPADQVADLIEAVSQALAQAERGVGVIRHEQPVEDKTEIIKRLRGEGVPLREIARRIGLSKRHVSRIAGPQEQGSRWARSRDERRAAAEKRKVEQAARREEARRQIRANSIGQEQAIVLLKDAGMSLRQIAIELEKSHEWVRRRLRVARKEGTR